MSKEPRRNVYVGHRYVPLIIGEWDKTETYEGLSIVTYQGASYTSKKRVPRGIDILNKEYWALTGNYNAQIEEYRKDVQDLQENVINVEHELKNDMISLEKNISDIEKENNERYMQSLEVNALNVLNPPPPFKPLNNDGSDVSKQLQDLINFANGNPVIIPKGEYGITKSIDLNSNTTIQLHSNAKLKTINNTKNIFSSFGEKKLSIPVTNDIFKGEKIIPLVDTSSLKEGDMIMVRNNKQLMNNVSKAGEIHFISKVSNNSITLTEPLWDDYKNSLDLNIDLIKPKENISITGGVIEGNGNLASQFSAMEFKYVKNVQISNTHIKNWAERGIMLSSVVYGVIEKNIFENIFDNTIYQPPTGYSVELSESTQWVDTINNFALNVNKLWDVSGEATRHGHTRFCKVINNKVYGSMRGAISTHACGEYFDIIGNTIYGSNNNVAGTGHSIYLRTPNCKIYDNLIFDSTGNGIDVRTEGRKGYFEIFNNSVINSGSHGIRVAPSNTVDRPNDDGILLHAKIKDNYIENSLNGIFITGNEKQNGDTKDIIIDGNHIKNNNNSGITITSSNINFNDINIKNNIIESDIGILLNPAGGYFINNPFIFGNDITAKSEGIKTEIQSRTVEPFINGNYIKSSIGISGFKDDDIINNKIIIKE